MATFTRFNQFLEDLCKKVHNLASDTLKVYLTNAAPDVAADAVKADLAEISAGNGYSAGGTAMTTVSCEQTGGVVAVKMDDKVIVTASGGQVGPFRYAVLYNDSPTSPADPLIGYWDRGASITLEDGDSFSLNLDETNGILQIGA